MSTFIHYCLKTGIITGCLRDTERTFKLIMSPIPKSKPWHSWMMSTKVRIGTNGGEGEIRTHGPLRGNGFQDRRIRPLCHLSLLQTYYQIRNLLFKYIQIKERCCVDACSIASTHLSTTTVSVVIPGMEDIEGIDILLGKAGGVCRHIRRLR